MPSSFLNKLFKSDKDKDKRKNKTSAFQSSSSSSSSPSASPHSDSHGSIGSPSSSNALHVPGHNEHHSAPLMKNSSSSSSFIHPVDSHAHLPHLKLNRFFEKRHLKHSSSRNSNNGSDSSSSNGQSHSMHKPAYPSHSAKQSSSNSVSSPAQAKSSSALTRPQHSKFNDYNALMQLVSKYGIIPDQSVDLMNLLEHTDLDSSYIDITNLKISENGNENDNDNDNDNANGIEDNATNTADTANAESQAHLDDAIKSNAHVDELRKDIPQVPESKAESTALVIGKGAGGSVYPLYDKKHNHLYAMKKLRLQMTREDWKSYEVKLQNEFKIAAALHHQNLIRTYDLLQDNDLFIIVMDYAPYDFFTMVMAGVLSKYEIYCYFKQMCTGVSYMHSVGLAHRDLKLDNCVVDKNGILKIVDFGSSVIFDRKLYEGKGKSIDHTKATGILGSDPYLAPEVISVPYYDPALADVWSLAIIFSCMVLRRFPWRIPKNSDLSFNYFISPPGEIIDKNGHKKVVGPDRLMRLLPTSSRHVIDHMLKIDPAERYTMDDVVQSNFYNKIKSCHYENYDSDRNRGNLVKGDDHSHHLITNKQFSEEHPEEVKKEKELDEEQAQKILSQNAASVAA
jgi:serine/threonine protein kinase